jgi:hypothetical protein
MPATATPVKTRKQRASKLDKILPFLYDNPGATIPEMEKALEITIQPLYLFNALPPSEDFPKRTNKVQKVGNKRNTDAEGKTLRGRPPVMWDLTDEQRAAIKKARKNDRERARRAAKQTEKAEPVIESALEPVEAEQVAA